MLATTVQFSNTTPPATHNQHHQPENTSRRYGAQGQPRHTKTPHTTCVASGPNSVSIEAGTQHIPSSSSPTPKGKEHTHKTHRNTGTSRVPRFLELPLPRNSRSGKSGLPPTSKTSWGRLLLRKEVIQPHLPVRLPCYDFVPIASPTFDHSLPQGVRPWASGVTDFHDVTGGVYKARERIHRSIADLRLLATPTSWGRVADPNPN
jgi:hypothetical protein